jgi:polar amino acid transport system substrate-binding protein
MAAALGAGLLSVAAYQAAARADEVTIESIKKAGVLRVGTWLQYQPEMYKDLKTGEIKGFWIELARKMATDLGVKLEIVDSDWDGLIPGLQSGKFEIVLAQMAITSKRAQAVDFAKPWEAVGMSLVLPADSTCDTVDCLNKPDKTISTEIGSVDQEVRKAFFPNAQETANKGHNDGFLQVVSHRSDGFLTDNVSALAYLKEHPGAVKIAFTGIDKPFLQAFPAGPALPKGSIAFARWVDIWLQDQINNGTYKKLYLQEIGWEPALEELGRQRGWYP